MLDQFFIELRSQFHRSCLHAAVQCHLILKTACFMNTCSVPSSVLCPHPRKGFLSSVHLLLLIKCKDLPQQAEVAQGVPGRLRPRIFLTFGTTRGVGLQSYAPATFTLGEIPGTHL